MRTAEIERNTKETKIRLRLNLDGEGKGEVQTGILRDKLFQFTVIGALHPLPVFFCLPRSLFMRLKRDRSAFFRPAVCDKHRNHVSIPFLCSV